MFIAYQIGDLVGFFVDWFNSLPLWQLYIAIMIVAYMENVIPPIPGDVLIAFCGYLVGIGKLQAVPLLITSTVGSAGGFLTLYYIGLQWKTLNRKKVPWKWIARLYHPRLEERVRRAMRKWGLWLIVANRFLAGMRTVISLVSGISNIRWRSAIICSLSSAFLWNAVIAFFGYQIGSNWELVGKYLAEYAKWIGIAIVLFIGMRYISSLYKKKN